MPSAYRRGRILWTQLGVLGGDRGMREAASWGRLRGAVCARRGGAPHTVTSTGLPKASKHLSLLARDHRGPVVGPAPDPSGLWRRSQRLPMSGDRVGGRREQLAAVSLPPTGPWHLQPVHLTFLVLWLTPPAFLQSVLSLLPPNEILLSVRCCPLK